MSTDREDPNMPAPPQPHAVPDVLKITANITEQTPPPPPAPTTLTGPKRGGGDLTATPPANPAEPRTTRGGSKP